MAAALLAIGLSASPAFAQTTTTCPGYPGCTTTTGPQPTSAFLDLGLRALGTSFDVSECNFAPNATITVVYSTPQQSNVPLTPSPVSDASGCIVLHVEIKPTLATMGILHSQHLLAATGLAAGTNAQVVVNGQTITVGPIGSVFESVSRGTGANTAPRTVTVRFTIVKKSTVDNSGLARTGTTIVRWSPLAIGLVGLGYLLVLASRRRRSTADIAE